MKDLKRLFAFLLIAVIFSLSSCGGGENADNGGDLDFPILSRGSSVILKYSGTDGYSWNKSALSEKLAHKEIIVVDGLKATEYKTRPMVEMLKALDAERKPLVVLPEVDKMTIKSFANIPGATTCQANNLNVYQILNHRKLIISKQSVEVMEEVYKA